jgi:alpha-D-xyloside xylohydrolase
MTWNDRAKTLTIGERKGAYPGMLNKRQFTIVMPDGSKQTVSYDGVEQKVKVSAVPSI